MSHMLLWLYPKAWRETYGDEFIALLEDLEWPLSGVLDAIRQGIREQLRYHLFGAIRLGAGIYFALTEYIAVRDHVTRNIFWMPHGIVSCLTLIAACISLSAVCFPRLITRIFLSTNKK